MFIQRPGRRYFTSDYGIPFSDPLLMSKPLVATIAIQFYDSKASITAYTATYKYRKGIVWF